MRQFTATELLEVWEQGLTESFIQRALLLMTKAWPKTKEEDFAGMIISERDKLLLMLREQTFGPQLVCAATCPNCGERLELAFNSKDICALVDETKTPPDELTLNLGDYKVRFRLPNSYDLLEIAGFSDIPSGKRALIDRCVLEFSLNGEIAQVGLPPDLTDMISSHMAEMDPLADLQLELRCPACGHKWLRIFDIVSFIWSEINAWAHHILREIHSLASSYGWSEAEILNMSHYRRQIYMEMIGK